MPLPTRPQSLVRQQLEAYRETWKRDHDDAMACRDWEDAIAFGLNVIVFLRERESHWRDQVYRGVIGYTREDDQDHQLRLADWLDVTTAVLRDRIPELEQRFGRVEGAERLRKAAEAGQAAFVNWQPPRLSAAVGLRDITLPPDAAAELDRILADAQVNPPPIPAGPLPKQLSAAEFLAARNAP